MITLTLFFHPLSSYCQKALIALYENDTPFRGQIVNLSDERARTDLLALWPTGKIPLLRDEKHNKIIPETSVIIEYLDQNYPGVRPLLPTSSALRLEARLWDRLFDNYVMTPMQAAVAQQLRPESERDKKAIADAVETLETAYDMIERQLDQKTWATGEHFSIADCAAAPALFFAEAVSEIPKSNHRLLDYFERLTQRQSVRRAVAEARPYFQYFPLKDAMPNRFRNDA